MVQLEQLIIFLMEQIISKERLEVLLDKILSDNYENYLVTVGVVSS